MIITTTPSVEKYNITQYLDIVTGADTYVVGGLIGEGLARQNSLFKQTAAAACSQMEYAARAIGADAIVGVSIMTEYLGTTGYVLVTASGTAVKIEESGWDDELPDM